MTGGRILEPRGARSAVKRHAVAAALATLALLVFRDTLDAPNASRRVATLPLVVALKDLPEGVAVDRTAIAVTQWPAGTRPVGAYTSIDSVANRVTDMVVYRGEAFVPDRLVPEGTGTEVRIAPGKRAYGIRVDDVAALAGLILPNTHVDVMVVADNPGTGRRVARLFLSDMRVLAMRTGGQRTKDGRPVRAAVASLEVTPDQAEKLAIAATQGSLQFVLRGYGDRALAPVR